MEEAKGKKSPYAAWHKAVLVGCAIIALLGTLGVIGMMVKVSGTVSEYGGTFGAPLVFAFIMIMLSVWLFAGSGAMLVYIAKTGSDISRRLAAVGPAAVVDGQ